MRARTQLPSHLSFETTLVLTVLVAVALFVTACSSSVQPPPTPNPNPKTTKVYPCRDRAIKIDKAYAHGVDQDVVVLCGGNNVSWKGNPPWEVDFTTSPFVSGVTVIKDTSLAPGPVLPEPLDQDTAFTYTVTTSDGKKFDPQIIIMGGN